MDLYERLYKNIGVFVKFRYNHSIPVKTKKDIYRELIKNDYITIDIPTADATILFTYADGKYNGINSTSRKLIKDKVNKKSKEIMHIIHCPINSDNLPAIYKFIGDIHKDLSQNIWVQIRSIACFEYNLPKQRQIPTHLKIDKKDLEEVLNKVYIDIKIIPKIREFDPPIVWLGLKPKEYVKVIRQSISSGTTTVYRQVI